MNYNNFLLGKKHYMLDYPHAVNALFLNFIHSIFYSFSRKTNGHFKISMKAKHFLFSSDFSFLFDTCGNRLLTTTNFLIYIFPTT